MKAIVLLNNAAGTLASRYGRHPEQSVAEALSIAGIEAEIRSVAGTELRGEAETAAASAADVVIAGGGDGTLSKVACALAGKQMPLGILPLGTLNHFARDLRIPLDLAGAADVIAAGHIGNVDVGEVNGRVFINNSSLGLYPRVVLEREAHRRRLRLSKWTALALAALRVFRRFPTIQVRLQIGEQDMLRMSPLVFIGNNAYQLDLFNIGRRACVDRGELSLYIATAHSRWGILKLTFRALVGGLEQTRDFELFCLSSCSIETRRHRLHVAVDGEVEELAPPLDYRVRPGALRVCLPEPPGRQQL